MRGEVDLSPITHFLAGWAVANTAKLNRRDRLLVTLAGVLPDVDGLGVLADLIGKDPADPFPFYQKFHHVFGHNIFFALLLAAGAALAGTRKVLVPLLVLGSVHLHFLGDIIGSRGPGDDFWPVPYLWPFAPLDLFWSRQWPLNGWQNFAITGTLMAFTLSWAWKRGRSPVEMLSENADRGFVAALRSRFGEPST